MACPEGAGVDDTWEIDKWLMTRLLDGLPENCKPHVARALENQRLINEGMYDSPKASVFKRVSIPLVRRLMEAFQDRFVSRQQLTTKVFYLNFKPSWELSLQDQFTEAMSSHNYMDRECDRVTGTFLLLVSQLKNFMESEGMEKMCFLGLGREDNGNIVVFYDKVEAV